MSKLSPGKSLKFNFLKGRTELRCGIKIAPDKLTRVTKLWLWGCVQSKVGKCVDNEDRRKSFDGSYDIKILPIRN